MSLADKLKRRNVEPDVVDEVIPDEESEAEDTVITDFKPDPDSKYRREHWPVYEYPKRQPFKVTSFMVIIACGVLFGGILGVTLWKYLSPIQHHQMYQGEQEQIEAKWEAVPITVRSAYVPLMMSASYYGTPEWAALAPEQNNDGSLTFHPQTKEDFYAFVKLLRKEIDDVIEEYSNDETYQGFTSATVGRDYYTVTVATPMKQESLIDQKKAAVLLRHMKIQSFFYDRAEEQTVTLVFVNSDTNKTVLNLTM